MFWWVLIFVVIIAIAIWMRRWGSVKEVWHDDITAIAMQNEDWRRVLATSDNMQVVAMTTPKGESLGWETHADNDQFFYVVDGEAELSTGECNGDATVLKNKVILRNGMGAIVPKGVCHNVVNRGDKLRMYTVYSPPHHPIGTVDKTYADEVSRS